MDRKGWLESLSTILKVETLAGWGLHHPRKSSRGETLPDPLYYKGVA